MADDIKRQLNIPYRGISYDTGTRYLSDITSREIWNLNMVRQDINRIKNELNCNSIAIFGSDPQRLIDCMKIALNYDLHVWLQPRIIDTDFEKMKKILINLAKEAEYFRTQVKSRIIFNVGCEYSLFSPGIVPGSNFKKRIIALSLMWWKIPTYNKRLNLQLHRLVKEIRRYFNGDITYSAGSWEEVDWEPFDFVGANYYRDASNTANYEKGLHKLFRHNKPVVITEFGCCCYQGAAEKGGGGFFIINWREKPPQIKGKRLRSEDVQGDYISELLKLYDRAGVHACFVFTYMEPTNLYSCNLKYDLDMASYGVVQAYPKDTDFSLEDIPIVRKQAYFIISELYRNE